MENMFKEVKEAKVTLKGDLEKITPTGNGVMVAVKSWPAQSMNGVLMPDQFRAVRAEKYITEVIKVGEEVELVKPGDVVVCSMYSGHHLATKEKHAKIVRDTDVLSFKDGEEHMNYRAETFKPGIDYILVKIETPKEIVTAAGLVVPAATIGNDHEKQDLATITAEVLAIGPNSGNRKTFSNVNVGSTIVFDSYVGLDVPNMDVMDEVKYRIMYIWDVIAVVDK